MATGGDGGMDWDEVTVLKKKAPKASEARSDKVLEGCYIQLNLQIIGTKGIFIAVHKLVHKSVNASA
jgi:hypothetical protein